MTPYGYHHGVSVFRYDVSSNTANQYVLNMTGTEFLNYTSSMSLSQREIQILLHLGLKNIPMNIFNNNELMPVVSYPNEATFKAIQSSTTNDIHNITFYVFKDY